MLNYQPHGTHSYDLQIYDYDTEVWASVKKGTISNFTTIYASDFLYYSDKIRVYCDSFKSWGNNMFICDIQVRGYEGKNNNPRYIQQTLDFPILTPQGFYNVKYLNVTNSSDWYYDLDSSVNVTDNNAIKETVFDNNFETKIEVDVRGGKTWFDIDPSCWGKYLYISYSHPSGGYIGCVMYGTSRGIYDIRNDWISGYTYGVVEGYSTIAIPIDENTVFCYLSSGTYSNIWQIHEIWVEDEPFTTT